MGGRLVPVYLLYKATLWISAVVSSPPKKTEKFLSRARVCFSILHSTLEFNDNFRKHLNRYRATANVEGCFNPKQELYG